MVLQIMLARNDSQHPVQRVGPPAKHIDQSNVRARDVEDVPGNDQWDVITRTLLHKL